MKRHWRVAALMGLMAGSGALAGRAGVQQQHDEFVIGGLLALSGPLGINGIEARKGMDLAVAERGGRLLGVPVELQWEDTESKPQVAVQKATKLLSTGAQFLLGAVGSGETLAVMKLAATRKIPLLVPLSTDPSITGAARNPYTFRTTLSGDSLTNAVVEYLREVKADKVYGIAADYPVARSSWSKVKSDLGGHLKVLGEDFPSLGQSDYAVIVNKIAGSGADTVVVALGGSDAVTFMKQAEEIHLRQKVKLVGMNLADSAMAEAAGPGALGAVSSLRYDFSIENEMNRKFVAAYRAKYKEYPSTLAGDAYDGLSWWLDVIEKTRSWRSEDWIAAFQNSSWSQSVVGSRAMRACDHQAQLPAFIAEVSAGQSPQPRYIMKVLKTLPPAAIATRCP
jgi:branched-chain amino acid transport system substrate-binding protein